MIDKLLNMWFWTKWSYCKWFGHKIVCVDSYANPDSGGESFECVRCGYNHDITYY